MLLVWNWLLGYLAGQCGLTSVFTNLLGCYLDFSFSWPPRTLGIMKVYFVCEYFACMWVCVPHSCLLPLNEDLRFSGAGVTYGYKMPHGCWESKIKPGLLQEERILLAAEPPLQPLISFYKGRWQLSFHDKGNFILLVSVPAEPSQTHEIMNYKGPLSLRTACSRASSADSEASGWDGPWNEYSWSRGPWGLCCHHLYSGLPWCQGTWGRKFLKGWLVVAIRDYKSVLSKLKWCSGKVPKLQHFFNIF